MNHSLNYLPLAALADRISENDFLTQIAGTPLWDDAQVRITSDWQPPGEGQLAIASRHEYALSWLFQELKTQTFFTELLDSEYFYRYLVKALWRHQFNCLQDCNSDEISDGDRHYWEQELNLDSPTLSDSLRANSPSRVIAGTVHEEDTPTGLLQAVLVAADRLFLTEFVDLFVYGSLMRGEINHYLLENAEYIADDAIADADLFNLGPYPMFVPGMGTLYGECYHIPLQIIPNLDRLEDHPHFYQRLWMLCLSGQTRLVYQGFASHIKGCPQIVSGSWRDRH
ncbi:gamma-glutamylcyclotransferase [Phormidium pseudopriestleyi FRX01]|uniref:Gamma-glutamylcyclotransferase n=1 Tax=Phormidium pseudopriestleyi FRX01 TaxID=1759528 RepID=A0ABS3FKI5_9CYAN|nr:gamma-glutamylcyclotransferase family protein [Phormidium pseudopriestleyi]MBO0347628.1 gamma-glutamylcyclotransferase [Phormidium pseudopriestleyi FRX01]